MALFEGIGRVADYAQLRNLRREMKYRIKTGQSLAEAMGKTAQPNKLTSSALQKTQKADANREMQIRQKLRQGQKLSATDKQYLKDNNPDLYEKVARIEERREALARALRDEVGRRLLAELQQCGRRLCRGRVRDDGGRRGGCR